MIIQMEWTMMDNASLHGYRYTHGIKSSPSFTNMRNQRSLSGLGIAQMSPTMARCSASRKTSKERLATSIQRDYSESVVQEQDVVAFFIYRVQNQGVWARSKLASDDLDFPAKNNKTASFACDMTFASRNNSPCQDSLLDPPILRLSILGCPRY